eukprot:COSAG02_NODE_18778_length_917_cov_24616.054878_2_plen_59_part_01
MGRAAAWSEFYVFIDRLMNQMNMFVRIDLAANKYEIDYILTERKLTQKEKPRPYLTSDG